MSATSAITRVWSLLAWGGLLYALWLLWLDQRALSGDRGRNLYRALAGLGFALTWTFMVILVAQDIARYPDFSAWSAQSNLFFDAYRRVTGTTAAWWWSQQLLLWAPAAVLFFHAESVRRGRAYWPYVWVGLCVAVSVALPLFLIRNEAQAPQGKRPAGASAWTGLCLSVSALATLVLPLVEGERFFWCILTVHVGVLLSTLPLAPRLSSKRLLQGLYLAFAAMAALAWWGTNVFLWSAPSAPLWQVIWKDPAQSSITLDVLVTTVVCALWVKRSDGVRAAMLFTLSAAFCSLGGAFCLHQLWRMRRQP